MKRGMLVWCVAIALTLGAAWGGQKVKEPMPLAVAYKNVSATCDMAKEELLVGKQSKLVDQSLATIYAALVAYEQYVASVGSAGE